MLPIMIYHILLFFDNLSYDITLYYIWDIIDYYIIVISHLACRYVSLSRR